MHIPILKKNLYYRNQDQHHQHQQLPAPISSYLNRSGSPGSDTMMFDQIFVNSI